MALGSLNNRRGLYAVVLVLVAACSSAGCGYHFRADGRPVGIELESLAIPLVDSPSAEMGFESDFTRIIREEFISHASVPLVPLDQAQALLSGRIHTIQETPVSYDGQAVHVSGYKTTYEVTDVRRLRVRLAMRLTSRPDGKVIWHERDMEEEENYEIGTDPLQNRFNRREALRKIARSLARRVYLKTMERF